MLNQLQGKKLHLHVLSPISSISACVCVYVCVEAGERVECEGDVLCIGPWKHVAHPLARVSEEEAELCVCVCVCVCVCA
jgi:hypothetical protein